MGSILRVAKVSQEDISTSVSHVHFQTWVNTHLMYRYKDLDVLTINEHAILYTWTGSDSSLKPLVFMAHTDVRFPSLQNSQNLTKSRLFQLQKLHRIDGPILRSQDTMMAIIYGVEDRKTTNRM